MNVFTKSVPANWKTPSRARLSTTSSTMQGKGCAYSLRAGRTTPAQTTVTLSTSARSLMQLASRSLLCSMSRKRNGPKTAKPATTALWVSNLLAA